MAKCVRWVQEQVVALLVTWRVLQPCVAQRPLRRSASYSQNAQLVTSACVSTGLRAGTKTPLTLHGAVLFIFERLLLCNSTTGGYYFYYYYYYYYSFNFKRRRHDLCRILYILIVLFLFSLNVCTCKNVSFILCIYIYIYIYIHICTHIFIFICFYIRDCGKRYFDLSVCAHKLED